MADFDQEAWLRRIGYRGPREPTLAVLRELVAAHALTIPYETIDPLLGRPPSLDLADLQRKMIAGGRGGYCFEQNTLFRAGLRSLRFPVTSLQARVVRNFPVDAPRPALHMVLRVDLPEGAFLADVGYGNVAPTAPVELRPVLEQRTPHEPMRFRTMGDELLLEARLGDLWEHIYRVIPYPRVDADYEIGNWFAATHPSSPFANNLILTRPAHGRRRLTLLNDRLTVRTTDGHADRRWLESLSEYLDILNDQFGLALSKVEVDAILVAMKRKRTPEPPPAFA